MLPPCVISMKTYIPLKFPREYARLYPLESIRLPEVGEKPGGMPDVAWNPWNDLRRRDDVAAAGPPFPYGPLGDEEYRKRVRQSYFAAVTYVDDLFGRLIAGIFGFHHCL